MNLFQNGTKAKELVDYLSNESSEVDPESIMKQLGYNKSSNVHSLINYVNNKIYPKKLILFDRKNNKYILNKVIYNKLLNNEIPSSKDNKISMLQNSDLNQTDKNVIKLTNNKTPIIDSVVPEEYLRDLNGMAPSDINDVIDLFKKAYFYRKCAIDLIESSKISDAIKQSFLVRSGL